MSAIRLKAEHHQIESAADRMRVDAFKGALDNRARNAVVRVIELAKGPRQGEKRG